MLYHNNQSALLLLVLGFAANYHDTSLAADDFAFLANRFDRWFDLHICVLHALYCYNYNNLTHKIKLE